MSVPNIAEFFKPSGPGAINLLNILGPSYCNAPLTLLLVPYPKFCAKS